MAITELGKELRKLRIDRDERLQDMAEKLRVSAAFLSAVEIGSKPAPDDFGERVVRAYRLKGEAAEVIRKAADRSRKIFRLRPISPVARDTAGLLARKFSTLSDEQLRSIRAILQADEGKKK